MKKLIFFILLSIRILSIPDYIYDHMKRDNPKLKDREIEWIYNKVDYYSLKYGIDPILVIAVMDQESSYNYKTVSRAGAVGLMQLMPETAKELKVNPYKAEENIMGGIIYLKQMLDRYEGRYKIHYGLAAYNAGAGAVRKYKGIPPYKETQDYVRKVIKNYNNLKRKYEMTAVNEDIDYLKENKGNNRKSIIFNQGITITFYKGGGDIGD